MYKKKKILITAGGTATAWHMSNIIREFYKDKIELHICDINPKELVASSKNADFFHRVPKIFDEGYKSKMMELIEVEKIDIIVPLIDWDLFLFSVDSADLVARNVFSSGPLVSTAELLSDKERMSIFLKENGIYTPTICDLNQISCERRYVVKPRIGCGSKGFKVLRGKEILETQELEKDMIIQELCDDGECEVTAEVFNTQNMVQVFCRKRIETKEGVCTKMQIVQEQEISETIHKLVSLIKMPTAFCMQFMKHRGHWNLIDCNLRIGAGTALATAAGFQLTRAFFANLLGENVENNWFEVDSSIKAVVRVYREEVMT